MSFMAIIITFIIVAMANGVPPFRGRVDVGRIVLSPLQRSTERKPLSPARDIKENLWYEARNLLQVWHVRLAWTLKMAMLRQEDRMFVVPGGKRCTTWDDAIRWEPHMIGLSVRQHHLRVRHNVDRHDMDNDAIVLEFATAETMREFRRRVDVASPTQGAALRDMLDTENRAMLDVLLERNRGNTAAERRSGFLGAIGLR